MNAGANVGTGLAYYSGYTSIVEFLSIEFHDQLVNTLKDRNEPVGILVDGSDSRNKNQMFSVYIVTLEGNVPHAYFYRILNVSTDLTARGMLESLLEAFEGDGILDFMRTKLFAISFDGASVMMNHENSFDNLLKKDSIDLESFRSGFRLIACSFHKKRSNRLSERCC